MYLMYPFRMRGLKFIAVSLFLCNSCLEPYSPDINPDSIDALVVDGHIDASGDGTILLSRAIPLYTFADSPKETGATVTIRSSQGESFNLAEIKPGTYNATGLPVNHSSIYTLYIKTSKGKEYESNTVRIHPTPDVDEIFFAVSASGNEIEFLTDSKDENPDATGYYAFECIETYEYTAQYFSRFKRVNGVPVLRHKGEFVDTCWHELPVPITLASTKRLSENRISRHKLTSIDKYSRKISRRYSILVRQRSISEEEFNFRTQLEKTNNQQGGLFAEIPGSVVGNIHSMSDPDEVVLGYFRGEEVKEKRYFTGRGSFPDSFQVDLPPEQCDLEATCPTNMPVNGPNQCIDVSLLSDSKIIITSNEVRNSTIYIFSSTECGDCTKKGGKNVPPPYWF